MKKYWEYLCLGWLALLPWSTVLIVREAAIEYNKILLYGTEVLFWVIFGVGFWCQYLPRPQFNWRLGLLCVWLVASVFGAMDIWLAWQSVRWLLLAMGVAWWLAKNKLSFVKQLLAVSLGFLPVVGLGIAQFFWQITWSVKWLGLVNHIAVEPGTSVVVGEFGRWLRAYGSFPHPNIFGGYLVLLILISALGIRLEQYRWFWLFLAGLSSATLILTFSRSAWLGLLVALLIGWKYFKDERLQIWVGVVSLVIAVTTVLVWPLISGRTQIIGVQEQQSVSERVSGWHEAMAVWRTQPLRGVGLGNYTVVLQQKFSGAPHWTYQPVHNVGLLLLAEVGLIGLMVIWLIFRNTSVVTVLPWWWIAPLVTIGLFDHYLLTLYSGWLLVGLWLGLWTKIVHR